MNNTSRTSVLGLVAVLGLIPMSAAHAQERPLVQNARPLVSSSPSTPPQITYSVLGDERSAVARLNPLTGKATALTSSQDLLSADAWSAKTHRIYYSRLAVGTSTPTFSTSSLSQSGGSGRLEVAGSLTLDISADATRIAYTRTDEQLYVAAADGSGERRLTGAGGFSPRFSPDGRRLVFTRLSGKQLDVFTIGVDGSGLRRITAAGANDLGGAFSPDGRRLLFSRETGAVPAGTAASPDSSADLYSVGIDGKGLRLVRKDAAFPDWATNGWLTYLVVGKKKDAQIAVRAPGLRGREAVLTADPSLISAVRFAR